MNQKGFAPILVILLVAAVIGGYLLYSGKINLNGSQPAKTQNTQILPSAIPSPAVSRAVSKKDSWQKYESGTVIDGLSFKYPGGWTVNYRKEYNLSKDYTAKYRLTFDFAPSGWSSPGSVDWLGWGTLSFDIYNPQTNINKFIAANYLEDKDKLISKEDTKIGNMPTFLVEGEGDSEWLPRNIVLGTHFSYEISHSQNGSDDFIKNINDKSGIFSYIQID